MRHKANHEGGKTSTISERSGNSRVFAGGLLLGLAASAAVLTGCEAEDKPTKSEPFGDFTVDCRPMGGWQEVPYKRSSNNLTGLARHIKTTEHAGAWKEHPCYDEAYTFARQATSEDYPYDGEAVLPKFLVPEGLTLRQVKNQQ